MGKLKMSWRIRLRTTARCRYCPSASKHALIGSTQALSDPGGEVLAAALAASASAFEVEARRRRDVQLSERALEALASPGACSSNLAHDNSQTLLGLGFSPHQVGEALRRCSTVESSVEWILQQVWEVGQ